jgi:hypothetical protein
MSDVHELVERVHQKHDQRFVELDQSIKSLREQLDRMFLSDLAEAKVHRELADRLEERSLCGGRHVALADRPRR